MGKWEMEKDEDFYKEIIKCYVKEYKKHRKTVRIPLSIFYPEMTDSIYIIGFNDDFYRKKFHLVKNQRQMDSLTGRAFFEFRLNQSNKTITDYIFDYAITDEIDKYIKKKEKKVA